MGASATEARGRAAALLSSGFGSPVRISRLFRSNADARLVRVTGRSAPRTLDAIPSCVRCFRKQRDQHVDLEDVLRAKGLDTTSGATRAPMPVRQPAISGAP